MNININKAGKITFVINEDIMYMIEELKRYFGTMNNSETLRWAISYTYNNTAGKDYVKVQRDRIKEKVTSKKPTIIDRNYNQEKLCQKLGGKIIIGANGNKYCEYKNFTQMAGGHQEESQQVVLLQDLNETHLNNQYN